jgi:hypothetical protein
LTEILLEGGILIRLDIVNEIQRERKQPGYFEGFRAAWAHQTTTDFSFLSEDLYFFLAGWTAGEHSERISMAMIEFEFTQLMSQIHRKIISGMY